LNCDDNAHLFHAGETVAVAEPVEAVEDLEPLSRAETAVSSGSIVAMPTDGDATEG